MRTIGLCVVALCLCSVALSQTCQLELVSNDIDLSQWLVHPTGLASPNQGIWTTFAGPGSTVDNSVTQSENPNPPTRLVSDFTIGSSQVIRGSLTGSNNAAGTADDDFIGFSVGLNCDNNDPIGCSGEVVNIVWGNGSDSPGGTASGLCLRRENIGAFTGCPATTNPTFCDEASDNINVNHGLDGHIQGGGSLFANPDNFHPALTCIETMTCPPGSPGRPCCDTICAASQKLAWTYDRAFDFVIFYTPSRLRVFVDELEMFDYRPAELDPPETLMQVNARASFTARSQPQDVFSNFQLLDTGTTSCTNDPWEQTIPADLSGCTGTVTLAVDWGDGQTEDVSPVGNEFQLSHVFPATPNGFFTVETTLESDGVPVVPASSETLLAFILDSVTPTLSPDPNGACGEPMTCAANSGSISLGGIAGGNGPYTITWSGPGVNQVDTEPDECLGATCSAQITGLNAGTYSVVSSDGNNCPGSASVTIAPSTVQITSLTSTTCGSITTSVTNSCGTPTYSWTDSNGNPTANPTDRNQSGLAPGTYTLVATDANGCSDTQSITIGYGLTGPFDDNDRIFMYVGGLITWADFPSGTTGTVRFRCPSVGTNDIIFQGDISATRSAEYKPNKILPAVDCLIEIQGGPAGCYDSVDPLYLCTHPNVGAPECFY